MENVKAGFPTLKDWCAASRPQYYIATIIPITLGFVLAASHTGIWRWFTFLLVLLASFFVHLAANLANDIFDSDSGVDNAGTIGGSTAVREGRLSRHDYLLALWLLYGLYALLSPFIILPSKEPILWLFAAFGVFSSIFYTAPPIRFGYRGLGEVLVFLNMGVIMVCGSYMACAHSFQWPVLAFAIIVGFMVAVILFFQSLPEIDTDGAGGKRTLAVHLGMEKAFLVYYISWPLIWLLVSMLWLTGLVGWPVFGWVFAVPAYCLTVRAMLSANHENLLELDRKGFLTRIIYLITGIFLIMSVLFPQQL